MPNTQFGLLHLPRVNSTPSWSSPQKCTKSLSPLMLLPLLPLMLLLLLTAP